MRLTLVAVFCCLVMWGSTGGAVLNNVLQDATIAMSQPQDSSTLPAETEPPPCADKNVFCAPWASVGECDNNPGYMLFNCQVSCKSCGYEASVGSGECEDDNNLCAAWAISGECETNPNYMLHNCRHACNNCQSG